MARSDMTMRVRAVGLDKSIIGQARSAERVLAAKPINLKLDPKGFMMPLGRITGQMSEFQKSLDASAARVFAFGAAVAVINSVGRAFKALVSDSIELQKGLIELNSIFRLSSKNLQQFGSDLFDVAKNTGQAFAEVTVAATELSRQGLTASETLKRLNDAMILTRLSGLAATDSVKYLTAAINGFNKEALSSTEIVNRLANVDAGFAVSSRDLADAISRSGAAAQSAKVEFNELLAIVTSVQQQTARGGAVIGNTFKTIFTRLQRSSVRGALEEIGVATENANGSLRSATQILEDYARAYKGLTDQQRAYTAEQVAGVRQVNNLKALINDMSGQYGIYSRALKTANNTTNEAIQRNAEYNRTISALAHQTSLSVKEMSAALGELMVGPGVERVLGMIQSIADFFNKVLDPQEGSKLAQGFMKGIGAYIAGPGLILIGGAFLKLFMIMGKLGKDAVKSIFAVNTETQRRRALEEAILQLLIKEDSAMKKLNASGVTQAQKEKIILDLLRQQTAERQRQASFLASLSGLPGLKGVAVSKQGAIVGKTRAATATLRPRAEGSVPSITKVAKTVEVASAIGLGAPRGTQAIKGRDRVGNYFFNSAEQRVSAPQLKDMGLNSKGRDMILPTYGSAKHENLKKLGGKLGVSPSRAEELFMGSGFVPNFRVSRPPRMEFKKGKGVGAYKKGFKSAGNYRPRVAAVVSQTPKGMGRAFRAAGRVGISPSMWPEKAGPFPARKDKLPLQNKYYANLGFPVGGLNNVDFLATLKKNFKFEKFVQDLGFPKGKRPPQVATSLNSALDSVGRNQTLGRIFEAAIQAGLRQSDLADAATWDIPNWQNIRGKTTFGLPGYVKDADVKYSITESKGNKTMMTMMSKSLATNPAMVTKIRQEIDRREGPVKKSKAAGFVPNFAVPGPVPAVRLAGGTRVKVGNMYQDEIEALSKTSLSNWTGKLNQKPSGSSPTAADRLYAKKIYDERTGAISATLASNRLKSRQKEARRIIFGLTTPQKAGVIAPMPGLRGIVKGDHNVPGYGKVKMGYRMFGYDKAGPAASQMSNLDKSVRNWSRGKSRALANAIMPGRHRFTRFANEGGISGASGSIFETAVQMGLHAPAFKKQTATFDFPRGSPELKRLQGAKNLFNVGLTDWVDASINPRDTGHMFPKIFSDIALRGGYFKSLKGKDKFKAAGKKMPIIPKLGKGGRFGAGSPFTLSKGFVPNFAPVTDLSTHVWDSDVYRGPGTPPYRKVLQKIINSGKPLDVSIAPSGAGKTHDAARLYGENSFIKTEADLARALKSKFPITVLSAMSRTKTGGVSPLSQQLLGAARSVEYLYAPNAQLLSQRNLRVHGGQHALDPRGQKQLQRMKYLPTNQWDFVSQVKKQVKKGGTPFNIRRLRNKGFVPNFANDLYSQAQRAIKTETKLNQGRGRSELGFDKRVGLGVYTAGGPDDQGSLKFAIDEHLKGGQTLPEVLGQSFTAQTQTMAAHGFVPNFATVWDAAQTKYTKEYLLSIGEKPAGEGGAPSNKQIRRALHTEGAAKLKLSTSPLDTSGGKATQSKPTGATGRRGATERPGTSPRQTPFLGGNPAPPMPAPRSTPPTVGGRPLYSEVGSSAEETRASRIEAQQAENERKREGRDREKEKKRQTKEARKGRMQMGLLGLSMAAPMAAEMLGPADGSAGLGAAKGGLGAAGIGAMVPMMMNNPAGWLIGGGIVAFGTLKGAIEATAQSAQELSKELDNDNAKRQQALNATNKVVQSQARLNEAYETGDIKAQIRHQDELSFALGKIVDPKVRDQILNASGDIKELGAVVEQLGKTAARKQTITNVLKGAAFASEKKEGMLGVRGTVSEVRSRMLAKDDSWMGQVAAWGVGVGQDDGFAGERLGFDVLQETGKTLATSVELTNQEVKEAYALLGEGTRSGVTEVLKKYFKLTSTEIGQLFEEFDFASGELGTTILEAVKEEERMVFSTNRLKAAMLSGAGQIMRMDGQIGRTADELTRKMGLVQEGFKKLSKTLIGLRKSTTEGMAAMGIMTGRQAGDSLMGFQEDVIRQQAQIDSEQVLRELLSETKEFNNRALKSEYQDVTMKDMVRDPLGFHQEKILSVLNRQSKLFQDQNTGIIDLNDKERDALNELQKINITSALSLIELRAQSLAARKLQERKSFAQARVPLTPSEDKDIRNAFAELFDREGKQPSIASEAETFMRLQKFFDIISKKFGIDPQELVSPAYKQAMATGGQFQEVFNLLQFVDRLGDFKLLNTDIRKRIEATPPTDIKTHAGQQQWLMKNLFGGKELHNLLSDVKLKPGQTVSDFYEKGGAGVDKIRRMVLSIFDPAETQRLQGTPRFEAMVEIIGKSLMRMITTARLEAMNVPARNKFQLKEERGFLQTALDQLLQEGKLDFKDIKSIFGPLVDSKGQIIATEKLGLSIVRGLVNDMASIKSPEFRTLMRIKENTGSTARLLSQYLTQEKENKRTVALAEENKEREAKIGGLITSLRAGAQKSGQGFWEGRQDKSPMGWLQDYEFGQDSPLLGAVRVSGGGAGHRATLVQREATPETEALMVAGETSADPQLKHRRGRMAGGSFTEALPVYIEGLMKGSAAGVGFGAIDPDRYISTLYGNVMGRENANVKYPGGDILGRGTDVPQSVHIQAITDILKMQLRAGLDIAAERRQHGTPLAEDETFASAKHLGKVFSMIRGGSGEVWQTQAQSVVREGVTLLQEVKNMLGQLRKRGAYDPGHTGAITNEDVVKWGRQNISNFPVSLREVKSKSGGNAVQDTLSELEAFITRIKGTRGDITGGVTVRGTEFTDFEMPDFSALDGQELIDAILGYENTLGMYSAAVARLQDADDIRMQKEGFKAEADLNIGQANERALRYKSEGDALLEERGQVEEGIEGFMPVATNPPLKTYKDPISGEELIDVAELRRIMSHDMVTDAEGKVVKEGSEEGIELLDMVRRLNQLLVDIPQVREKQVGQEKLSDALIVRREAGLKALDQKALIISSAIEGAATHLQGIDGDASKIKGAFDRAVRIFNNMTKELQDLKAGDAPPRLEGKPSIVPWFQQMGDKFKKLWSAKATGFIPNMSSPVQTAFKTEKAMGGSPALDYHPKAGGWFVRDKKTQPNFAAVQRDHPDLRKDMAKSYENQRAVEARGAIPNFYLADRMKATSRSSFVPNFQVLQPSSASGIRGALDYLPHVGLEQWNQLSSGQQQAIGLELRMAMGGGGAFERMQKKAFAAHGLTRKTHSGAEDVGMKGLGLPSMDWYKQVYKGKLDPKGPLGSGKAGKLPDWYIKSDMGQFLEAMKTDDWPTMAFFYDSIMSEHDRQQLDISEVQRPGSATPENPKGTFYPAGKAPKELKAKIMQLLSDRRQQPGGIMNRIRKLDELKVRRPDSNAPTRHPRARGFIPNFVDPNVKIPQISTSQLTKLEDIALTAQGHSKGFHSTIERVLADEDAVRELAKRLGVTPDELPDLIHKNIARGQIPAAAVGAVPDLPKPAPGTLLPPERPSTQALSPLESAARRPTKRQVGTTLKSYIAQEMAGAALLEKAGIPHGGILGATPHGVIKADLSKTHIDLEDWYKKNYQGNNLVVPPRKGASDAVRALYEQKMAPKHVMLMVESKFRRAALDAGLTGSGRGSGGAFDMRSTNFMAPSDSMERINAAVAKGDSLDDIAEQIWKSRDVKFVDPGKVATVDQIKMFERGGAAAITGDVPFTGPPRLEGTVQVPAAPPAPAPHARPKTPLWKKALKFLPWIGAGAGIYAADQYRKEGKPIRAWLAGIGTVFEPADWLASGIDIAEFISEQDPKKAYMGAVKLAHPMFKMEPGTALEMFSRSGARYEEKEKFVETFGEGLRLRAKFLEQGIDPMILSDDELIRMIETGKGPKGALLPDLLKGMGGVKAGGLIPNFAPPGPPIDPSLGGGDWSYREGLERTLGDVNKEANIGKHTPTKVFKRHDDLRKRVRDGGTFTPETHLPDKEVTRGQQLNEPWDDKQKRQRRVNLKKEGGYREAETFEERKKKIDANNEKFRKKMEARDAKVDKKIPQRKKAPWNRWPAKYLPGIGGAFNELAARDYGKEGKHFRKWLSRVGAFFEPADWATLGIDLLEKIPTDWGDDANMPSALQGDFGMGWGHGVETPNQRKQRIDLEKKDAGRPKDLLPVDMMREGHFAQGFIPNFASDAWDVDPRTGPGLRDRTSDTKGATSRSNALSKPGAVGVPNLVTAIPRFHDEAFRVLDMMTLGYPENEKEALKKRLEERLKSPVFGVSRPRASMSARARYSDTGDFMIFGTKSMANLQTDKPQARNLSSLRNEMTHFIQDNVLKSAGTSAPLAAIQLVEKTGLGRHKVIREQGFTAEEAQGLTKNVEQLAWAYYEQHQGDPDGGYGALANFISYESLYEGGSSVGDRDPVDASGQTYGGYQGLRREGSGARAKMKRYSRSETYKLFDLIAKAHGAKIKWKGNPAKIRYRKDSDGVVRAENDVEWGGSIERGFKVRSDGTKVYNKQYTSFSHYFKDLGNQKGQPDYYKLAPKWLTSVRGGKHGAFAEKSAMVEDPEVYRGKVMSHLITLDKEIATYENATPPQDPPQELVEAREYWDKARDADTFGRIKQRLPIETQSTLVAWVMGGKDYVSPKDKKAAEASAKEYQDLVNTFVYNKEDEENIVVTEDGPVRAGAPTGKTYEVKHGGSKGKKLTGYAAVNAMMADKYYAANMGPNSPQGRRREQQRLAQKQEALRSANATLVEAGLEPFGKEGFGDQGLPEGHPDLLPYGETPKLDAQQKKAQDRRVYYGELTSKAKTMTYDEIQAAFKEDQKWGELAEHGGVDRSMWMGPRDLAQIRVPRMPEYTKNLLKEREMKLKKDAIKIALFAEGQQGDVGKMADIYEQQGPGKKARMKEALDTLTNSAYGAELLSGTMPLGGEFDSVKQYETLRRAVTGESVTENILNELREQIGGKDKQEKIDYLKDLASKRKLGLYLQEHPGRQPEIAELIEGDKQQFEGNQDPYIQAVMNVGAQGVLDEDTIIDGQSVGEMIDKEARVGRKLDYVAALNRRRTLARTLSRSAPEKREEMIKFIRQNQRLIGEGPTMDLITSGRAKAVITGTATTLDLLSAIQDGSFGGKFRDLTPAQRQHLVDQLPNHPELKLGDSLKDTMQRDILKDRGIELDNLGLPQLHRGDFGTADEYWAAKDKRFQDELKKRESKMQAGLAARRRGTGRIDGVSAAQRALEKKIIERHKKDQGPLPEFDNLAKGFIPNFGRIFNRKGESIPYWGPGSFGHSDRERESIEGSRMRGEYDPTTGFEKGDWDYRGYMKSSGYPATPGSKVLPSLVKGRPAKEGAEYFSISQQHGKVGEWFKGVKGRKLQLGNQEVTVVGTEGENIKVKTSSGEIITIPLRGAAAQETNMESIRVNKATIQKKIEAQVGPHLDDLYGPKSSGGDNAQGFFPNFKTSEQGPGTVTVKPQTSSGQEQPYYRAYQAKSARSARFPGIKEGIWGDEAWMEAWRKERGLKPKKSHAQGFFPNFAKGISMGAAKAEQAAARKLGDTIKLGDVVSVPSRDKELRGSTMYKNETFVSRQHLNDLGIAADGDAVLPSPAVMARTNFKQRFVDQAKDSETKFAAEGLMKSTAKGFVPNFQPQASNISIEGVDELQAIVGGIESAVAQLGTTFSEGVHTTSDQVVSMNVGGIDPGPILEAVGGAASNAMSQAAGKTVAKTVWNLNQLDGIPPFPDDLPNMSQEGNVT